MNANTKIGYLTKERDELSSKLDTAEVKLQSHEKENEILKSTNTGLESKNNEIFRQLEREISMKARDYKERALGTLSGNPLNNTMQTPDISELATSKIYRPANTMTTPDRSEFAASKIYRPTISKMHSPFESA